MRRTTCGFLVGLIGLGGMMIGAGCRDTNPPPARVPVPSANNGDAPMIRRSDEVKALPREMPEDAVAQLPFDDVPLVNQQVPEQPRFVEAYRQVGSPRIVVFINRTLEGNIVPVNANDPLVSVERTQRSTAGVDVERRSTYTNDSRYRTRTGEVTDNFKSNGPGEFSERTDVYLRPGQYDEIAAKSLDYEAVENILTDVLSCDGKVTIISPAMARQRLSDQQVKELQEGRPQVMNEIVQQLGADILVQVQAHPTRQTAQGLEVRLVAEALNVKGGESIARAVVDIPPPLEKITINRYTRFVGRKLMDGMLGSWSSPPPARPQGNAAPNSGTTNAPQNAPGNTPGGNTPGGNAPGGNAPGGNAPRNDDTAQPPPPAQFGPPTPMTPPTQP